MLSPPEPMPPPRATGGPAQSRPRPYLPLTTSDRYDKLVRLGWRLGTAPAVPLDEPIDWSLPSDERRSWHYHLQALDPIEPALVRWSQLGDLEALRLAVSVVRDWITAHGNQTDPAANEAVWYDMAVGLRAYRLSYLLDEALDARLMDEVQIEALLRSLQVHLEVLLDEDRFAAHSNHGFFQAAGLLALTRKVLRPQDREQGAAVATERLRMILERHFAVDGVHKEHSPDYHLAILEGFKALIRAELLNDEGMFQRIARAERALSWFVKPDGRLVNFGDSDHRPVPPAVLEDLQPLREGMRAFSEGGYVAVRAHGERGQTYLAQTLCFHSRTHKQADDMSLIWTDRGTDILIDAGRYAYGAKTEPQGELRRKGFWYSDPTRLFVESTAAHNTIEIDGESHDRRRRPYGSALLAAGELGGVRYAMGRVRHGTVSHSRLWLLSPGQWLCLVDGLAQRSPQERDYRQWLHFSPAWTVTAQGDGFFAERQETGAALRVVPLGDPARAEGPHLGQIRPLRQGWWSPAANKIEPAPAVAFRRRGAQAVIATLFAFDDTGDVSGQVAMKPSLSGKLLLDIGRKRIRIVHQSDEIEIAFRRLSA